MIDGIAEYYKKDLLNSSFLSSYIEETGYQILIIRGLTPSHDDIVYDLFCFLFKDQKFINTILKKTTLNNSLKMYRYTRYWSHCWPKIAILFRHSLRRLRLWRKASMQDSFHLILSICGLIFEMSYQKLIDIIKGCLNHSRSIDKARTVQTCLTRVNYKRSFPKYTSRSQKPKMSSRASIVCTTTTTQLKVTGSIKVYLFLRSFRDCFYHSTSSSVFFGMNTEKLYLAGNENGTNIVALILLGIIVVQLFFIPLFKVLDRFLLRYMLGRIDLYKKLNAKFDKISETFKVD
jgi:hypothetical protein